MIARSLLFALSFFALSCLIVDHREWPEKRGVDVLNARQESQTHCLPVWGRINNLSPSLLAISAIDRLDSLHTPGQRLFPRSRRGAS